MTLDLIILAVIGISALFAWYRGLMRELLGLASWVIVFFGAWYGCALVQPVFEQFIKNPEVAKWAGMASLAFGILIICAIINALIAHKLRKTFLKTPDQMLGFVFGVLRGLLIVALVYFALTRALSPREWSPYLEESHLSPVLIACDSFVEQALPDSAAAYFSDMRREPPHPGKKPEKAEGDKKSDKKDAPKDDGKPEDSPYDELQRKAMDKLIEQI